MENFPFLWDLFIPGYLNVQIEWYSLSALYSNIPRTNSQWVVRYWKLDSLNELLSFSNYCVQPYISIVFFDDFYPVVI